MHLKMFRLFICSAGCLFLAFAVAAFISNETSITQARLHDPSLGISMRNVLWIVGGTSLMVAQLCLFSTRYVLATSLVTLTASGLVIYRLHYLLGGYLGFNTYLDTFSDAFAATPSNVNLTLAFLVMYLLIGGFSSFLWLWLNKRKLLAESKRA
jgi:hypothetical protein